MARQYRSVAAPRRRSWCVSGGRDEGSMRWAAADRLAMSCVAGLVEEHEAHRVHGALPGPPASASARHVGPSCSVLSRTFLCRRPIQRSALWMVESPATMPRRPRISACSWASMMSRVASTSRRSSFSCGANNRRRRPPSRRRGPGPWPAQARQPGHRRRPACGHPSQSDAALRNFFLMRPGNR
jgi:hypothetical protein